MSGEPPVVSGSPRLDQFIHDATNHPPINDSVVMALETCRDAAIHAAEHYCSVAPPSRELSLALTSLEESLMWARAAVARHQEVIPRPSGS